MQHAHGLYKDPQHQTENKTKPKNPLTTGGNRSSGTGEPAMSAAVRCKEEKEEKDRKPVIKPGVHVTLKVQDTDGRSVYHTMRRTEKLQGLMDFYYARVAPAVAYGTGRFLYDGGRLGGAQTPEELEMEDGDEVDFFSELLGGAAGRVPGPMDA